MKIKTQAAFDLAMKFNIIFYHLKEALIKYRALSEQEKDLFIEQVEKAVKYMKKSSKKD